MRNHSKWFTLIAIIAGMLFVAPAVASITVTGTVTAQGGGALSGITVRTAGDPSYSTVTGSAGTYSLSLPAGAGATYAILASGAGLTPQRVPVTGADAASITVNFSLRPVDAGETLSLPAPLEWGEPSAAPTPPGDSFPVAFSDMSALPASGAPKVSEYNEIVKPDESFTLTGYRFTTRSGDDAGTDTTVWVWARTTETSGVLRQAKIWKVKDNYVVATMPDDIPFGMYLVWVENSDGVSAPIAINRTTTSWIGPMGDTTYAGGKRRVFGRNLSYNHGATTEGVSAYIRPASGGTYTPCTVTKVDPYSVEFTVPEGTANGSYLAYIHNGHGGAYGWGDPLKFTVADQFVRSTAETIVNPAGGGADDGPVINAAINALSAQPTGGTVKLVAGTYSIKSPIQIKSKVALRGAGMNSTTLLWQAATTYNYGLDMSGQSNASMSEFTFTVASGSKTPNGDFNAYQSPGGKISSIRVNAQVNDGRIRAMYTPDQASQCEVSGCEFYREISFWGSNWIHNNTFYGDFYFTVPNPVYSSYDTEAGCGMYASNDVYEYNHSETKNWPVQDGSRNYDPLSGGFMTVEQLIQTTWCMRVALCYTSNSYIANNTAKDVAVQTGKGEMLLFHTFYAPWFGQVLSNNGLTLTARTDGKIFDQTVVLDNYTQADSGGPGTTGGGLITQNWQWWSPGTKYHAVIVGGKGMGQARTVAYGGATPNTISIESPWTVAPDSTSVVIFTGEWTGNIVYNNDFSAFPPGYQHSWSASNGVQFDGNAWKNFVEGNTSRRTECGRSMWAWSAGPNSWNEERDETAIDCHSQGFVVRIDQQNPFGPVAIGDTFRNCSGNLTSLITSPPTGGLSGVGLGIIVENSNVTAPIGCILPGSYMGTTSRFGVSAWPDGCVLYRNGSVATNDSPLEPVLLTSNNGSQLLINNTYSGNAQPYWYGSGVTSFVAPVPAQWVARFSGYAGYPVQSVLVPVSNGGTIPMTWTATTSDPWIAASVQANGTLVAENTLGRVAIGVNTAGMTVGRHWGSVTINAGGQSAKIGVCVDIAAGTPPNSLPVASFTAAPVGGPTPFAVGVNASASYDSDGMITSHYWDFGDGGYASGVAASHTYTEPGLYTVKLTVTDDDGAEASAWSNVEVTPALSSVALTGVPNTLINAGTTVTCTAAATGGYQVQYKFLLRTATGWSTLRDYQSSGTCTWTPSAAGYYEIKVWAKNSGSTNAYDAVSNVLSYPVGMLPTGMKLWLKADAGVSKDSTGAVNTWADQSGTGNNVQGSGALRPACVENAQNDRPAIRFSGSGQILQATSQVLNGNVAFSTFTVGRMNQVNAGTLQYFWWNGVVTGTNGGYGVYDYTTGRVTASWSSTAAYLEGTQQASSNVWYRIATTFTGGALGATHSMWIDGESMGTKSKSGANLSGGTFAVGNCAADPTKALFGDVAEIIIYDRMLTAQERANVEDYLSKRWSTPTTVSLDRIKDVKALGDGVLVSITSPKIATVASDVFSDGGIYVIDSDRVAGLKVTGAGTVDLWDNLTLTGTTDTDVATGERVLRVTSVAKAAGTDPGTLGMSNKTFSPSGQYIRVWGKVTGKTSTYLTVDDGSGSPVKVQIDGLVSPIASTPGLGSYISATGTAALGAGGVPAVRVRSISDIRVY